MRKGLYPIAFIAMSASFSSSVVAQTAADVPVDWGGYTWIRDRYEPDEFDPIGSFNGRSDVVKIVIGEDGFENLTEHRDPGYAPSFWDTQGRKAIVNLPGASFATADLYIPESWKNQKAANWQTTGLWGSVFTPTGPGTEAVVGYPTIIFTNSAQPYGNTGTSVTPVGALGGRIQVFDDNTGLYNIISQPVTYNGWNTLRFEIHSNRYEFYLNGKLVFTDTNVNGNPNDYLKEIFLNSKNNNIEEYEAFYANVLAGLLASPTDFQIVGSVPGMTQTYQFNALGDFVSRRGLAASREFSLQQSAWAYIGGLTGDFDLSNGASFDGDAYYARFGTDIFQPVKGLRLGITGSTGKSRTEDFSGKAEADNYSFGAYLTYVDKEFYVEALGEYAWGTWDIEIPGQSKTDVDVRSFVGSAEAGISIWLSNALSLVPNAQAVILSSDYDDLSFGSVSAEYDTDTSLIGRAGARLQYDLPQLFAGTYVYLGASVIKDISGDSSTILKSAAFAGGVPVSLSGGGLEEASVQIAGGLDVKLTESARLYSDVTYTTGGDSDSVSGKGGVSIKW